MRCAIVQPSYIPWRGYFDLIRRSDVFVFYDDVQYDARGWRNRNRVKTPAGTQWLTFPVHSAGSQTRHIPICEIETADTDWPRRHLATLTRLYGRAPHFEEYSPWLQKVFSTRPRKLADFTIALTIDIAGFLGITGTRFIRSSELGFPGRKTERLIAVLQKIGATHYLSGPSAKSYIDEKRFADAQIALEWMQYDYPEYPQLYPPYDPQVTVLDLLFMTGDEAPKFIWR